jgi:ubiquinone/menaquinone biosynthesis C-methylase UbiE
MNSNITHDLAVPLNQEDKAKRAFVSALRVHVLQHMSNSMKSRYEDYVKPEAKKRGNACETPEQIHKALKSDFVFKAYSSARTTAQEMVFDVVSDSVDREFETLKAKANPVAKKGSLTLDDTVEIPKSVSEIDVHLAPGSYHAEYAEEDFATGAVYDNAIEVFSFGQFGKDSNDIGMTLSNYVRLKFPEFKPAKILDAGCTIGHNTLPWAQTFPDAEVTAIDVAAPVLRYGHARAESMGVPVHFRQMDATAMKFEDNTFDVVFSSMFLHELPLKDIQTYLKEAHRVLKPGGLLWQMELPPMNQMPAYDNFYLNWDTYYNNEPFYGTFRRQDYRKLLTDAGFGADEFMEATMPRYTFVGEEAYKEALSGDNTFDSLTGRMDPNGTRWYGFGAWKR